MDYAAERNYYPVVIDMEAPSDNDEFQQLYSESRHHVPVKKSLKIHKKYEPFEFKASSESTRHVEKMDYFYVNVPIHLRGKKQMEQAVETIFDRNH